jgi:hypothetical protein
VRKREGPPIFFVATPLHPCGPPAPLPSPLNPLSPPPQYITRSLASTTGGYHDGVDAGAAASAALGGASLSPAAADDDTGQAPALPVTGHRDSVVVSPTCFWDDDPSFPLLSRHALYLREGEGREGGVREGEGRGGKRV